MVKVNKATRRREMPSFEPVYLEKETPPQRDGALGSGWKADSAAAISAAPSGIKHLRVTFAVEPEVEHETQVRLWKRFREGVEASGVLVPLSALDLTRFPPRLSNDAYVYYYAPVSFRAESPDGKPHPGQLVLVRADGVRVWGPKPYTLGEDVTFDAETPGSMLPSVTAQADNVTAEVHAFFIPDEQPPQTVGPLRTSSDAYPQRQLAVRGAALRDALASTGAGRAVPVGVFRPDLELDEGFRQYGEGFAPEYENEPGVVRLSHERYNDALFFNGRLRSRVGRFVLKAEQLPADLATRLANERGEVTRIFVDSQQAAAQAERLIQNQAYDEAAAAIQSIHATLPQKAQLEQKLRENRQSR